MYKMVRFIAADSILQEIKAGNYALGAVYIEHGTTEEITSENICELCNELNGPLNILEDITYVCEETNISHTCEDDGCLI